MLQYEAFHPGLHCLPKYQFEGIQNENGLDLIDLKSKDTVCEDIMLSKQLITMMLISLHKCGFFYSLIPYIDFHQLG